MRVWITRSEPGATRLANHLAPLGYDCRLAPLIDIHPTHEAPPTGRFEHVIFLSEHAVSCAFEQGASVAERAQWYAIGPATAAALESNRRPTALPVITPAGAASGASDSSDSSEGLLELPMLAAVQNQRVLVVAGEGGRDTLVTELRKRGARVERWCVYRRALLQSQTLTPKARDVCIASSAAVLEALVEKWLGAGGELSAPICVPSQRVAQQAKQLGWTQVWVSDGPAPAAVAATLLDVAANKDC